MNGTPYSIGDREFIVPRLRVGAYDRALALLDAHDQAFPKGAADPAGMRSYLEANAAAIREVLLENYPELAVAEVKDLLYMDAIAETMAGLLRAAGKKTAAEGEAVSPSPT